MIDAEIVLHGKALKAIRQSDGFVALEALIERKGRDRFEEWASGLKQSGKELSREWCAGYMAALDEIISGVDEMIRQAGERDPYAPEQAGTGSPALGRGDLAS